MYQSQQYLEIGGKFIVNPFREDESLHGVYLHDVLLQLHESGAKHVNDFRNVLMSAIECRIGPSDMAKATAIYKRIMAKLSELGVEPNTTAH